jgi:hypothetical protein
MLRPFGPGLPGDDIAHRYGFEGNEPDDVKSFCAEHKTLGIRSTFTINTFYEEIQGGFYVNRSLFELVDRALRSVGIFPVVLSAWRENGIVPIEGEGRLFEQKQYVLAELPQSQIGVLNIWAFYAGGGGLYYEDDRIFDIILPEDRTRRLIDQVEARCDAASVRFTRVPQVTEPCRPPRGFGNWLTRR